MDEQEYRIEFHGFALVTAESEEAAKAAFLNDGGDYAEFTIDTVKED